MKPKTLVADLRGDLNKFVDDLDDLSIHTSTAKIKVESAPGSTSFDAAGVDISRSLFVLEKDLDSLLQSGEPEATICRGDSGCFGASDLMITFIPEGRFVHWRGMKLSDLLEAEDRLVAHLELLPFQEGRPLATMVEEST
jgi:hypothetical protein